MPYRPPAHRLTALVLALLGYCAAVQAQVLQPVKWSHATEVADGKTYLVHTAKIQDGWNVYSQYLESDDGPVRTAITYEELSGAQTVGRGEESGGRDAGFDAVFEMNVVKFKKTYVIRQEVAGFDAGTVSGYLTYMACDATQCLPPTDVEFALTPAATAPGRTDAPTQSSARPKEAVAKAAAKATGALRSARKPRGGDEAAAAKTIPRTAPAEPAQEEPVAVEAARVAVAPTAEPAAGSESAAEETSPPNDGLAAADVPPAEGTNGPTAGALVEPVTWRFGVSPTDEPDVYHLVATATVADGWNIYAQDSDEGGPIPTSFAFDVADGYDLLDGVAEAGKRKVGYDETFGVEVAKLYGPEVSFEQAVRVTDPEALVTGYLEYMACDQTQCLPPADVAFTYLPAQGIARLGEVDAATLLQGGDPNSQYEIDNSNEGATCSTADAEALTVEAGDGLGMVFLLGFGGGLLALLTPCVFPMIPLTVSFFTGRGKDRKRGFRRALLYGASIIVIYVGLGLLITSLFGADALNAFSTDPWVNIAFGVLFVVFALSFFGLFEITLPSSWANKSDRAADQGGLLGIFFMAFTLSLVSFSCTGPIIGSLLVETAAGGGATVFGRIPTAPLVGMLGFSTALALPFTLFALFPSALSSLPKSGSWMNTVKVTLGVLEIAFAMKFFSTADLIMGTKWMPYELFLAIWVACALGLGAYYLYNARPAATRGGARWSTSGLVMGLLAFGLGAYLATGFRYDAQTRAFDTPNLASGLAPPPGHSYVYEKDCPRDFDCFKDYDEGLAYAREVGKPILLDFTGHGCVNCRRMEDQVWGEEGVHERIKEDYVLISLYVDEREALEEPFVSDFSDRKLRTVGSKWADFQARYFNKNSQPYYVLMSPEQEVLNQPVAYTPEVDEYAAFLECGLSRFRALAGEGLSGL